MKTDCIIESISREDVLRLAKKYYQLSDQVDMIKEKYDETDTDFDFFRYRIPRREFSDELKSKIRKKFRAALGRFFRKYKDGEEDIPKALKMIKEYQI